MNDPRKIYQSQEEIDAAWSSGDADFKGAIFKCYVDFSGKTFQGRVDFTSAVFEDGASFKDVVFRCHDVLFNDAVFQSPINDVTFENAQFNNRPGNLFFNYCRFENGGGVNFFQVNFNSGGDVWFESASFSNGGEVNFGGASFSNEGSVYFYDADFSNLVSVNFGHVVFSNRGVVRFDSASFSNGGGVDFDFASFLNGEYVDFKSASFSNDGWVSFSGARFINNGPLFFQQMIWANSGELIWKEVNFKETKAVKFDECLFLPEGDISFREARFPKDGSLMFQRCYFAKTLVIDFTGAFFRHTTFEGGKISWLEDQKERSLIAIMKNRLKEKFDDLPQEAKDRIDKLGMEIPEFSNVFAPDVKVLWKDLTTESAKNLTFRLTNLSDSTFDGMTLSHIQLNAPEWAEHDDRTALYEEKKLRDAGGRLSMEDLRNIGDQYTQLKNNLERQGNFPDAGDFHFAEQEIRFERLKVEREEKRKSIQWPDISVFKTEKLRMARIKAFGNDLWKVFATEAKSYFLSFLTYCYRQLSGYGERSARAIIMFILFLFGFSVLVFPFNEGRFFQTLADMVTPFSWRKELKGYHSLLIPFQLFLLGIQLPLMILAIRRRFKR